MDIRFSVILSNCYGFIDINYYIKLYICFQNVNEVMFGMNCFLQNVNQVILVLIVLVFVFLGILDVSVMNVVNVFWICIVSL